MEPKLARNEKVKRLISNLPTDEVFDLNKVWISHSSPRLDYFQSRDDRTVPHWGQFKLLACVLFYLTAYISRIPAGKKPVVVYAGSSPGYNILILKELLPSIEWHLYDSVESVFDDRTKGLDRTNIHTYRGLFTNEIARSWSGRDDVMFISDIRDTSYYVKGTQRVNERLIVKDMKMQSEWVNLIKPNSALLKMRLPWPGHGIADTFRYLQGRIMLQPFVGRTSTETRLIVTPNEEGRYKTINYSIKDYESALFYHNAVVREGQHYLDPIINTHDVPDNGNMDDRFDSRFYLMICDWYLKKRQGSKSTGQDRFNQALALSKYMRNQLRLVLGKPRLTLKYIRDNMIEEVVKDDE